MSLLLSSLVLAFGTWCAPDAWYLGDEVLGLALSLDGTQILTSDQAAAIAWSELSPDAEVGLVARAGDHQFWARSGKNAGLYAVDRDRPWLRGQLVPGSVFATCAQGASLWTLHDEDGQLMPALLDLHTKTWSSFSLEHLVVEAMRASDVSEVAAAAALRIMDLAVERQWEARSEVVEAFVGHPDVAVRVRAAEDTQFEGARARATVWLLLNDAEALVRDVMFSRLSECDRASRAGWYRALLKHRDVSIDWRARLALLELDPEASLWFADPVLEDEWVAAVNHRLLFQPNRRLAQLLYRVTASSGLPDRREAFDAVSAEAYP